MCCVAGAFVVCWTPGLVILLMDGLNCTKCHVTKLKRWLLLLAVLNSVMNPCIYSYKDEEMWATIKNLMCCIGNGTRRQRSTKANTRPLSSAQDTGNSQVPSEEVKNDSDILKTWRRSLSRRVTELWSCAHRDPETESDALLERTRKLGQTSSLAGGPSRPSVRLEGVVR